MTFFTNKTEGLTSCEKILKFQEETCRVFVKSEGVRQALHNICKLLFSKLKKKKSDITKAEILNYKFTRKNYVDILTKSDSLIEELSGDVFDFAKNKNEEDFKELAEGLAKGTETPDKNICELMEIYHEYIKEAALLGLPD